MALLFKTNDSRSLGDNPFDYLTKLKQHAVELSNEPANRMPWNYRKMLVPAATTTECHAALPHATRCPPTRFAVDYAAPHHEIAATHARRKDTPD